MALTASHGGLDAPVRATCAVFWSVHTIGPLGPSGGGWTWGEVQGAASATPGRGGRVLGHPRSWRPGRGPQDSPGRLEAASQMVTRTEGGQGSGPCLVWPSWPGAEGPHASVIWL